MNKMCIIIRFSFLLINIMWQTVPFNKYLKLHLSCFSILHFKKVPNGRKKDSCTDKQLDEGRSDYYTKIKGKVECFMYKVLAPFQRILQFLVIRNALKTQTLKHKRNLSWNTLSLQLRRTRFTRNHIPYRTPSVNQYWAILNASLSCNIICSLSCLKFASFKRILTTQKWKFQQSGQTSTEREIVCSIPKLNFIFTLGPSLTIVKSDWTQVWQVKIWKSVYLSVMMRKCIYTGPVLKRTWC